MEIPTTCPINLSILPMQNIEGFRRMAVNYHKQSNGIPNYTLLMFQIVVPFLEQSILPMILVKQVLIWEVFFILFLLSQ